MATQTREVRTGQNPRESAVSTRQNGSRRVSRSKQSQSNTDDYNHVQAGAGMGIMAAGGAAEVAVMGLTAAGVAFPPLLPAVGAVLFVGGAVVVAKSRK